MVIAEARWASQASHRTWPRSDPGTHSVAGILRVAIDPAARWPGNYEAVRRFLCSPRTTMRFLTDANPMACPQPWGCRAS